MILVAVVLSQIRAQDGDLLKQSVFEGVESGS